jgi:hypothetical protein
VLEQWVPLVVGVALVLILPVGVVGDRRATDGARLWERLLGVEDEDGLRAGYEPESSVNLVPVSQEEEERGAQSGLEEGGRSRGGVSRKRSAFSPRGAHRRSSEHGCPCTPCCSRTTSERARRRACEEMRRTQSGQERKVRGLDVEAVRLTCHPEQRRGKAQTGSVVGGRATAASGSM